MSTTSSRPGRQNFSVDLPGYSKNEVIVLLIFEVVNLFIFFIDETLSQLPVFMPLRRAPKIAHTTGEMQMPPYVLKLYANDGIESRETRSIVIQAIDNAAAIAEAPLTPRPLMDNIALAVLMQPDGTPIWLSRLHAS